MIALQQMTRCVAGDWNCIRGFTLQQTTGIAADNLLCSRRLELQQTIYFTADGLLCSRRIIELHYVHQLSCLLHLQPFYQSNLVTGLSPSPVT